MIRQLGSVCSRIFYHTCPDPFVIAILLTLVAAGLALAFGDADFTAAQLLDSWRDGNNGLWKLLPFAMQMCLILVTGHALAATPLVRRAIQRTAGAPNTAAQAAGLVGLVACLTAIINWGLGLIVGALMAREVGRAMHRKGIAVHYPLLAAAGYVGLMVWHGGLSGSAPLSVTSAGEAAKVLPPAAAALLGPDGVSLGRTLFSPLNIFTTGGLLVLTPLMLMQLSPRGRDEMRTIEHFPGALSGADERERSAATVAEPIRTLPDWLDRTPTVSLVLAAALLAALARFVAARAGGGAVGGVVSGLQSIGLNEINTLMLALGLILHGSPRAYMAAVEDGVRGCSGIIIQFPLYAGIMAIMTASGLVRQIADMFSTYGNATTVPMFTFWSACIVNLFIPSGGGQWAVQGPIALQAGTDAGVPEIGTMVMSVAYGDQLTNMLQPFWALPLLGITGVSARDIVGYTAVVMLAGFVWISLGLVFF